VNYHCPTCARKTNVRNKCRLEAENKARQEAELRAIAKLEKDREERGVADELAGAMNEFFAALYIDDITTGYDDLAAEGSSGVAYGTSSLSELPLASPDSITVTTEFGVLEETGNVTIISASGPSPHHAAYDNDTEEENNVEMTEDLHDDIPLLQQQSHAQQSSSQTHHEQGPSSSTDVDTDSQVEHMQDISDDEDDELNDTGEEADIDTDDFDVDADAESAIIEEFLDDVDGGVGSGLLTPVATSSHNTTL